MKAKKIKSTPKLKGGAEKKNSEVEVLDPAPLIPGAEPEVLPKEIVADPIIAELGEGVEILPPEPELADLGHVEPDGLADLDEGAGVVPYDSLRAYLREISSYPRLNREEEHALAVRYKKYDEIEAAYKLVTSNLWLVVKIARDYERAARSILDLIQEGNIGLMEAVKNFDPYRGVRFPSYAVWWIKAYIVRYVIANWRLVKIGTTQAQRKLFFNLKKEKEKLERAGFVAGPKLLAEKLDVRESDIVEMEQRLSSPDVSFDAPVQSDSDTNLLGLVPSSELSAEDLVAKKQFQELLTAGLTEFGATLNKRELVVFEKRMLNEEKATLQDLAEELSLSRERIRQIENRLKEKLKAFLVEKYGSTIESLDF